MLSEPFQVLTSMFQYITCYSLSKSSRRKDIYTVKFQYITCYSLSMAGQFQNLLKGSFNTSHVTLYQLTVHIRPAWYNVSIHHMLLFIVGVGLVVPPPPSFQYITCYSLSNKWEESTLREKRFNTSHVTLYRLRMWKLSDICTSFNTSHVTLYQIPKQRIRACGVLFQYITCYSLSNERDSFQS